MTLESNEGILDSPKDRRQAKKRAQKQVRQKTAYCSTLMSYHKGQAGSRDYKPGDIIFLTSPARQTLAHVGSYERWYGTYITTIFHHTINLK